MPFLRVGPSSIHMKNYTSLKSIKVISLCPAPHGDRYLLPLKDHGQVLVVWHDRHKVSPREREPGRPIRLQLWAPKYSREAFGLRLVPQVLVFSPLKICVAHDRPRVPQTVAIFIDRSLHVREVCGEDGHFVPRRRPLSYNILVPPLDEGYMRVYLHGEVLTAVHSVPEMASEDGPDGQFSIHLEDVYSVRVFAQCLFLVFKTWFDGGRALIVSFSDLINDSNADPLGEFGSAKDGFDRVAALPVSVGCYCNVDSRIAPW
mmetsp:Transcript_16734/g.33316  ORF Transcript_16734/g.33316 Transcript_16734/m.33316 type:complete len:260 (-) Transcript_16734:1023-1802(-)